MKKLKICILGTESVGKSTLTNQIKEELGFDVLHEYGREYVLNKDVLTMGVNDYQNIIKGHLKQFDVLNFENNIVLDTDTITTVSWCYLMTGQKITIEHKDLCDYYIFLMNKNVEFIQDGTRVTEHIRDKHEKILLDLIDEYNIKDKTYFYEVSKDNNIKERNKNIINFLKILI